MIFKTLRDNMMIRQQATAKNIENYEKERQDTHEFEQKPIKAKNNRSRNEPKNAEQPDVNKQKSQKLKNLN